MKQKAKLDHGWEVEWCKNVPVFPDGSADIDNADYQVTEFKDKADALAFAEDRLPHDAFGSVRVTEFEYTAPDPQYPWYKTKDFISDTEYVEAE